MEGLGVGVMRTICLPFRSSCSGSVTNVGMREGRVVDALILLWFYAASFPFGLKSLSAAYQVNGQRAKKRDKPSDRQLEPPLLVAEPRIADDKHRYPSRIPDHQCDDHEHGKQWLHEFDA